MCVNIYQLSAHENTLLSVERGEMSVPQAARVLKLQLDYALRSFPDRRDQVTALGIYRKAMNELTRGGL